jgi:predicted nucleic acid-binding protein
MLDFVLRAPSIQPILVMPLQELHVSAISSAQASAHIDSMPASNPDKPAVQSHFNSFILQAEGDRKLLSFDNAAARHYAIIRPICAVDGSNNAIGVEEVMVAAHARAMDMTLITPNVDWLSRLTQLNVKVLTYTR